MENWDRIYPFVLNRDFFAKFHSRHIFLLIICHYGAMFRKNPESGLQDMKLRSFGWKIGTKFTHLSQTRIFCKISFMPFFSTHYLSLWCHVSKKSLERIARYEVTQFWAEKWDQIYPFVSNIDFLQNFIHVIFFSSLFLIMVPSFNKIFRVDSKIFKKV